MADDIVLKIGGVVYSGWKAVSVKTMLASLTSTFDLSITERWPGQPARQSIQTGQRCEVWIGDDLVITGWIDRRRRKLNRSEYTITVSGRDVTCDLVDCSPAAKPTTWKNQKLDKIVTDLIAPFGLKLKVLAPTGAAFPNFVSDQGERVFEAIARACRMRGVMVGTDNRGNVVIFTPSQTAISGSLSEGVNIEDIDVDDDAKDRFSLYVAKGQAQGKDWTTAADAAQPKGSATDAGVTRYRPIVIIADEQATAGGMQTRAAWEATTRAAKSQKVTVQVRGWRNADGELWTPGTLIPVNAPLSEVQLTMMISEVELSIDDKGKVAKLILVRKEAFTVELLDDAETMEIATKKGTRGNLTAGLPAGTIMENFKP